MSRWRLRSLISTNEEQLRRDVYLSIIYEKNKKMKVHAAIVILFISVTQFKSIECGVSLDVHLFFLVVIKMLRIKSVEKNFAWF